MASLYAFPGSTYLPSFRNGVLMMSSDFWAYLAECLYTAGVVLHMSVGLRIERLSFLLFLLTNLQLHMPVALGIERRRLSCYSTVHYAGRLI